MLSRQHLLLGGGARWVLSGASIDMDFANGRYFGGLLASLLSTSRASSGTDLLPSSVSGFAYSTFANTILRITPGLGLLIEEARTNVLLNSTAPVTQTTGSLATGTYTLWVNGSGSAAVSAGTATITGAGSATNGAPITFVVTVAGTVTVTKTGSLNAFQLELGAFGTSLVVTAGASATRAADVATFTGALLAVFNGTSGSALLQTSATPNAANFPFLMANAAHAISFSRLLSNTSFRSTVSAVNLDVTLGSGSFASGTVKQGSAWSVSGRSVVGNNGTLLTDGNSLSAADVQFAMFDGYIQRLTAFNSRLPNATLQALTA